MTAFAIYPLTAGDRDWMRALVTARWGAPTVVAHGVVYDPATLPGFYALYQAERVGLVTCHLTGDACEIVTLDSLCEDIGIGTALIAAARKMAMAAGCRRLWLITTNDNLPPLRFYQERGFRLAALNLGAVDAARQIKPQIPLIGLDGIPIHDEIVLELVLTEPAT